MVRVFLHAGRGERNGIPRGIAIPTQKPGLPNGSSHQFSVTIKTEIPNPAQVPGETNRLYGLRQTGVDREMQTTGGRMEPAPFLPFARRGGSLKNSQWARARPRPAHFEP